MLIESLIGVDCDGVEGTKVTTRVAHDSLGMLVSQWENYGADCPGGRLCVLDRATKPLV